MLPVRREIVASVSIIVLVAHFMVVLGWTNIHGYVKRTPGTISITSTDQHGVSHSFQDDNLVVRRKVIEVARDEVRPSIDESRSYPYVVSAVDAGYYEHLLIENLNSKRFAGTFYNTQPKFEYQQITTDEKMQLDGKPIAFMLDFSGRYSTEAMKIDSISCSKFTFTTAADTEAYLILNQMHDPRWKVSVNGAPGEMIRANKYFMGVKVGPGENAVSFVFLDHAFIVSSCISAITMIVLIAVAVTRIRRTRDMKHIAG
jgi:hypothetical protein